MQCSHCGNPNASDATYCSSCNEPLQQLQSPPPLSSQQKPTQPLSEHQPPPLSADNRQSIDDTNAMYPVNEADALFAAFVGEKYASYYRKKWFKETEPVIEPDKVEMKGFSFNAASFFLGIFWLCYRRMPIYAAVYIVIINLVDIGLMHMLGMQNYNNLGSTVFTGAWVAMGFLGNYLYLVHSTKQIKQTIADSADIEMARIKLAEQGGTSWLMGIAGGLLLIILSIGMIYLLAPAWYFTY